MLQTHQGHIARCLLHEQLLAFVEAAQFHWNMDLGHVVQMPHRERFLAITIPRLPVSLATGTTILSTFLMRAHFQADGGRFATVTVFK
jgi:hypothetical protein